MKTFKLDSNGDVVITNNKIEIVKGIDLIVQTLHQVIGTNLGEWFGNENEGIDFSVILTKNPNYDLIQETIDTAVQYVADTLEVELETDDFTYNLNGRTLAVTFTLTQTTEDTTETATVGLEL